MLKDELNEAVNARLTQIDIALAVLPDETAVDTITLFRKWEPGLDLTVWQRLQYQEKLYKVVQAHTSQVGWEPDKVPALFTEVAKPGEIPVWKQPTGAQDAYMSGDKVHYPTKNDPVWESDVDNNVWQPGVYGWTQVE